jgi:hypothetical protein
LFNPTATVVVFWLCRNDFSRHCDFVFLVK